VSVEPSVATVGNDYSPFEWLAHVLINFAVGEQAIGTLCLELKLPIEKGSLSSLADLRRRLAAAGESRCNALNLRIQRWSDNRPQRHLLAHATIQCLTDSAGRLVVVTRHLPREKDDVTPDKAWTTDERQEILRQATNDGRSIADQVRNIISDRQLINKLRAA